MANLLWLQGGACSGNTMSFLNAEEPSACDLVTDFGINVLWHPSLGLELGDNVQAHAAKMRFAARCRSIFSSSRAPSSTRRTAPANGTASAGRPMKDWVKDLSSVGAIRRRDRRLRDLGRHSCDRAQSVAKARACNSSSARHGGFLGAGFKSKAGLPVINIPGCPAHPDWITQIVVAVATGAAGDLALDDLQRPKTFFTSFTQTGCTRNMHFAYKVSATEFGQRKGCLFYDLGCRGPMTHSPVQPHPVEPAIVEDPRGHAVPRLHRAGIPVLRSRARHRVQDANRDGRAEGYADGRRARSATSS